MRDLAGGVPGQWLSSRAPILPPSSSPTLLRHPRESGDPWSAPNFLDSHFRGKDGLGDGNVGLGGGRTKGDHPFSVGAQHDVPREITRFPKGHVKPCPYGTCETALVAFPVNGCHAEPPSSPPFVNLAEAGIHGPRHAFWIPASVGKTGWGLGMTNWGIREDKGRSSGASPGFTL